MSGRNFSSEILNETLYNIASILNENEIDWFIAYGTLLGIIRNKSCIDNDDDIDIIINKKYINKLKTALLKNKFSVKDYKTRFVQAKKKGQAQIDFYCCLYDDQNKSYDDEWSNILWSKCKCKIRDRFIKRKWNLTTLNIPYKYSEKLSKIYGKDWRFPKKYKVPDIKTKIKI